LTNKPEPRLEREPLLVAKTRDRRPAHQLHHEIRPPRRRRTRIEHPRDVRMVHQRKRLPFRLEPRDHLARVHPGLDDLECDLRRHRLLLLCQ